MSDILNILYKLKIFTIQDLIQALDGKVKSVASLLTRYKQKGCIIQIRRNTFCMIDYELI